MHHFWNQFPISYFSKTIQGYSKNTRFLMLLDDATCSQERSPGEIMTPKVAKINIYQSYTKTST